MKTIAIKAKRHVFICKRCGEAVPLKVANPLMKDKRLCKDCVMK